MPERKAAAGSLYVDKLNILNLIQKAKYEPLDKIFRDYQVRYEAGKASEFLIDNALSTFSFIDESIEKNINTWVKSKPASYVPWVVCGVYFDNAGWTARGSKFIQDTTNQQISKMKFYFNKSKECYKKAIMLNPKLVNAHAGLISIAAANGYAGEKYKLYKAALVKNSGSYLVHSQYMFYLQEKWGGTPVEMNNILQETQKYKKLNPDLKRLQGLPDYYKGKALLGKGELKKAQIKFNVSEKFGTSSNLYLSLSKLNVDLGDLDSAMIHVNNALDIYPQSVNCLKQRGWIYFRMQNYSAAKKDFSLALKIDPTNNSAWQGFAQTLRQLNDVEGALNAFANAIKFDAKDSFSYWNRGNISLYQLHDAKRAYEDYKEAVRLEPNDDNFVYYEIQALLNLNNKVALVNAASRYLKLCKNRQCNPETLNLIRYISKLKNK